MDEKAPFTDSLPSCSAGAYLPRASETTFHITYDADGNLTGDSLWTYVWNGENQLVEMVMKTGTGISGTTRKRMLFDYDWQGRRIQKRVYHDNGWVGGRRKPPKRVDLSMTAGS